MNENYIETYPRVLIVSHNALSKSANNGKTIETFFGKWPKECLSHLFFSPEEEDFDFCNQSFCVTDYDMLNSIFPFSKKTYGEVLDSEGDNNNYKQYCTFVKSLYKKTRLSTNRGKMLEYIHEQSVNRKPFVSFARQSVWINYKKCLPQIYKWLDKIRPDAVFFQGGSSSFSYNIVHEICLRYSIPLFLQCTDDYTLPLYKESLFNKYISKKYIEAFCRGLQYSSCVYAISDKMVAEYRKKYGGRKYIVLSNSIKRNIGYNEIDSKAIYKVVFAGNIGLNRWETMCAFGRTIDIINAENSIKKIELDIYTNSQMTMNIEEAFNTVDCINMKGFVTPKELDAIVAEADYLLHVESFDDTNKRVTRLSMSTKIGEYIGSNRCIIAIGPPDIASIEYIKENNLGHVYSSMDDINDVERVKKMFTDSETYNLYIKNAKIEYDKRFSVEHIQTEVLTSIRGF